MEAKSENGNGDKALPKPAVALAGIVALIAPLGAAIGVLATSGLIGRIQRDEPTLVFVALALLILAGSLWVLASLLSQKEPPPSSRWWIFGAGVLVAYIGFLLAFLATVNVANHSPRPQIHAKLNQKRTNLQIQVSASSMASHDKLAIQIVALTRKGNKAGVLSFKAPQQLYSSVVGPDEDGKVSQTFSAPVPKHAFTDIAINASTGDLLPACQTSNVPVQPTDKQITVNELSGATSGESTAGCVIFFIKRRF